MPSVTYDGRSFMVDGRRVWLASGRIPYARVPRDSWAQRIAMAKWAGLNCIETPVFWNRHEVRAGRFDFTGDNDLRHFIDLCGKAGMVILALGRTLGRIGTLAACPRTCVSPGPRGVRTNNQQFLRRLRGSSARW
jgi:beta-galactosidase GanA